MSKPDIIPKTSTAGIAVNPRTLERVIPESRRPDGTLRKEIKIRPGFTPQEDVSRFRGSRQAQKDANQLPKGHIIGWAPPPSASAPKAAAGMSKSAKKNAKRKEKRDEKKATEVAEKIKDSWEDDDEDDAVPAQKDKGEQKETKVDEGKAEISKDADSLADKLEKLDVR